MTKRRNVPHDVHEMLLAITKVFYDETHSSLINLLVFHIHLTESELVDLLGFDYSTLRSILNKLKCDKLIDVKMIMTTDQDGKSVNKSFYYINFKQAINSFMYRLELCYKKLEEAQRQDISSGDYKCQDCGDTYNDMDIAAMFDQDKGCIYCRTCHGSVEAIEDKDKRHSAREEIARFNTKIRNPFIELFTKIKEQHLADDMIHPEIKQSSNSVNDTSETEPQQGALIMSNEIMVNLTSNATWNDSFNKDRESKANPAWISSKVANNFTISDGVNDVSNGGGEKNAAANQNYNVTQTMAPGRVPGAISAINSLTPSSTDVMAVLLANEYAPENSLKYYYDCQQAAQLTAPLAPLAPPSWPPTNKFNIVIGGLVKKIWDVSEEDLAKIGEEDVHRVMLMGQLLHDLCYDS